MKKISFGSPEYISHMNKIEKKQESEEAIFGFEFISKCIDNKCSQLEKKELLEDLRGDIDMALWTHHVNETMRAIVVEYEKIRSENESFSLHERINPISALLTHSINSNNVKLWLKEATNNCLDYRDWRKSVTRLGVEGVNKYMIDYILDKNSSLHDDLSNEIDSLEVDKLRIDVISFLMLNKKKDQSKKMPDSILEEILPEYVKSRKLANEKFKKEVLPELCNSFKESVELNRKEGLVPKYLNSKLVQDKMDRIKVVLADPILVDRDSIHGQLDTESFVMEIQDLEDLKKMKRSFYHEMVHALSGMLYVSKTDNKGSVHVDELRFALSVKSKKDLFGNKDEYEEEYPSWRFDWLNEAVTEKIAMLLDGDVKSDSYEKERELLDLMIEQSDLGVDINEEKSTWDMLMAAYFEDFSQDKTSSDTSIAKVWVGISKRLGYGVMKNLDAMVKNEGIEETLKKFREDPRSFKKNKMLYTSRT